ncbi:hypothetical protein J2Y69_003389 [Microbacterium resistens]|uniref:DUF2637 domain-containing protein n=1 Tax=Microbacterium resistens TaxID=156977 RepID=A0ABU1SGN5_9MICO|nr:DUF2637 domain-containing protein [Microbacterium resistens]MDR6868765.1 hypothetical protein [Microbacterium resistens]
MTTSRVQPDSRPVLIVATVTTALLAAVSFLLSFNGLAEAASWANVPDWLAWALPAYVDGAILVYTVAALVFRSRGDDARLEWAALALFAALSVAANGVHAWATAPGWVQVALGITLAALAPVSVLLTTHTIAKLIVAPPTPEAPKRREGQRTTFAVVDEAHTWPARRAAVLEHAAANPEVEPDHSRPAPLHELAETHGARAVFASAADRNARIHELAAEGWSLRTIAAEVGCSKSNVARVLGKRPDADDPGDTADRAA